MFHGVSVLTCTKGPDAEPDALINVDNRAKYLLIFPAGLTELKPMAA